jgi:hypothetical protein
MRLMTFDPSAVCGFAFGDPLDESTLPISGAYKLQKGDPLTKRLVALEAWAIDRLKGANITDVVIEMPFLPKHGDFNALSVLIGYTITLGIAAQKCGCNCTLIAQQSWRAELGLPATGPKNIMKDPYYAEKYGKRKGGGEKEAKREYVKAAAIAFVKKLGSDPADDNEADALCIWYAMAQAKRRKVAAPAFDFGKDLDI